jgi:hypothetical protein
MLKDFNLAGTFPRPIGDMPGIALDETLYTLGGALGESSTDEIFAVDRLGSANLVGRLSVRLRGHQAVMVGKDIFVMGGFDEGTRAETFRLTPGTWKSEPTRPMPLGLAWFTATSRGNHIFVVGGYSIPSGYWDKIAVYDTQRDHWEVLEGSFPEDIFPRKTIGGNAAVTHQGRIFSFGGADEFRAESMRANARPIAALYDVDSKRWQSLNGTVQPREGLVAAQHGGFAYLIGGMAEDHTEASAVVEQVDLASGAIRDFARLRTGRTAPAAGIVRDTIVVAGGAIKPPFGMTADIETLVLPSPSRS